MRAAPPVPKDGPRINDEIREREVHLIDKDGANRGPVHRVDFQKDIGSRSASQVSNGLASSGRAAH